MRSTNLLTTQVLPKLSLVLLVSFISTIVGMLFIPPVLSLVLGVVALIMLIFYTFNKGKKGEITNYGIVLSMKFVYLMSILLGVTISPAITFYLSSIGGFWVAAGIGITTLLFGSLTIYAYKSKRDFSFLGVFLFYALIALIIVSIIAIFIGSSFLHFVLAWVGILIFSGYMLYDVSRIKDKYFTEKDVPAAVLDLYLNFINLLLDVLRIIWYFVSND